MKSEAARALRAALFEAAFVVLGVVLALAANEWRQSLADRQQSLEVLDAIIREVEGNRASVTESLEYHSGLVRVLTADHPSDWMPSVLDFPRGFVSAAPVSRTAWDSAAATGALQKTDFSVVVELSQVYAQQERYEAQARSVGELIYEQLFKGGAESIARNHANLVSVVSTFVFREQALLALYDEKLESLRALQR